MCEKVRVPRRTPQRRKQVTANEGLHSRGTVRIDPEFVRLTETRQQHTTHQEPLEQQKHEKPGKEQDHSPDGH